MLLINFFKKMIVRNFNLIVLCTQKKITRFATKSSDILISSRWLGSTFQKRSLLYKMQKTKSKRKKFVFFYPVDEVELYDIQITTNKFCIARMYSCMCGVFIL
jgi:hypothetical protein